MRTVVAAIKAFRAHGMTDHAAGLTYRLAMALFPGLLVGVSVFGLIADPSTVVNATSYLHDAGASASVVRAVHDALANLVRSSSGKAGVALGVGLLLGLNSASGAFGAAGRALNVVAGIEEDRGFVARKLRDLWVTIVIVALGLVAIAGVLLGGGVAHDLLGSIGFSDGLAQAFSVVRFPIAATAMVLAFDIVYRYAPNTEGLPGRTEPGAAAGAALWLLVSLGFFLYVANFGSYGATYGAFAGAIVLLLWLYLSSIAFLLGGELNAVLDRGRAARAPAASDTDRPGPGT